MDIVRGAIVLLFCAVGALSSVYYGLLMLTNLFYREPHEPLFMPRFLCQNNRMELSLELLEFKYPRLEPQFFCLKPELEQWCEEQKIKYWCEEQKMNYSVYCGPYIIFTSKKHAMLFKLWWG